MSVDVYALSKQYGPFLKVSPLDGPRLMAAIAGVESSFGEDCTPRYEAAYDFGGKYADQPPQSELLTHWGKQAAFSYGPWQILPCNARGFTPKELFEDPEKAALAFVSFVNRYVIDLNHAGTFDAICQCYNAGHYSLHPSPGVARYVEDAFVHYSDPRVMHALEMVC